MNFARRVLPGISAALVGGILSAGIAAANPIFDGWYADPQIRLYGDAYWIFPTASAPFGKQTSFDAFSSRDMKTWTKHPRILTTNEVTWAKGAMWRDMTPKGYVEGLSCSSGRAGGISCTPPVHGRVTTTA